MSNTDSDSSGPSQKGNVTPSASSGPSQKDIVTPSAAARQVSTRATKTDSSSDFSDADDDWEVLDILAERTVRGGGENQLLVVWKPTWTPASKVREGQVLWQWQANAKYIPSNGQFVRLPFAILSESEKHPVHCPVTSSKGSDDATRTSFQKNPKRSRK